MATPAPLVVPLRSADASLELVGGKGRSLAQLATADFPVPSGFLVTTTAYQDFVQANHLTQLIGAILRDGGSATADSLEENAARVRSLFQAEMPVQTADSVREAYAALSETAPSVAVRSSATAEDLPDLSFAGQQDSYLNVRGEEALLDAIGQCWASLWTARAIAYRAQMHIDQQSIAMAVVVQLMVPSEVAGILFTANPMTGERSELIVNACYGLGEAVVGGYVTPDSYTVDRDSLEAKETVVGAQREMIVPGTTSGTTTEPVPDAKRNCLTLSAELVRELASMSIKVEQLFAGVPQDIEWAVADGTCWLLQSRPITNLPPPPIHDISWELPSPRDKFIRRQVVENMPGPLSPLFDELYLHDGLEESIDKMIADFRMPFDIGDLMERPMFVTVNGYAYCRANYRSGWRLVRIMPLVFGWYAISFRRLVRSAIPRWRDEGLPAYLHTIEQWKSVDVSAASDQQLLSGIRKLAVADAFYWFSVAIVLAMAKVTDGLLNRFLSSRAVKGKLSSALFLRGFPSKALEPQQALEDIARKLRTNSALCQRVLDVSATELMSTLENEPGGDVIRDEVEQYFQDYGHQVYTLDFVEPTQTENPLPVLSNLQSIVKFERYNTVARQQQMAREREVLENETLAALGPLRRWLLRKFLGWAQTYGPYREEALFYIGAGWPALRSLALELGRRLVEAEILMSPDDVFYLETPELEAACRARREQRQDAHFGQTAQQRRELREARKKLHPPGLLPVGSRFKFGPFDFSAFETQKRNAPDANTLEGFAVSPGHGDRRGQRYRVTGRI